MKDFVVVVKKVADLVIIFFQLPSKTEWALIYSPETICLHSEACCTHGTAELDLYTKEIPYAMGLVYT